MGITIQIKKKDLFLIIAIMILISGITMIISGDGTDSWQNHGHDEGEIEDVATQTWVSGRFVSSEGMSWEPINLEEDSYGGWTSVCEDDFFRRCNPNGNDNLDDCHSDGRKVFTCPLTLETTCTDYEGASGETNKRTVTCRKAYKLVLTTPKYKYD